MITWTKATNGAASSRYTPATLARATTSQSAAWTTLRLVTPAPPPSPPTTGRPGGGLGRGDRRGGRLHSRGLLGGGRLARGGPGGRLGAAHVGGLGLGAGGPLGLAGRHQPVEGGLVDAGLDAHRRGRRPGGGRRSRGGCGCRGRRGRGRPSGRR